MATFKDLVKDLTVTDEERAKLTPEEVARLEQYLKDLQTQEFEPVKLVNEARFDAKDMRPANQPGPVKWKLVEEPPLPKK